MVDGFLNHRVDTGVMEGIGEQLAALLEPFEPSMILTAEASGIPPAMAAATRMGLPFVYAKKFVGVGHDSSYGRDVSSPTKGTEYRVEVRRHVLPPGSRVAVVDDFLARGRTAEALGEIVADSGGTVAASAFVIEKSSLGGRRLLESHGWTVLSLVRIGSLERGSITFENE